MDKKKRITVIMGGPSSEAEVSRRTGGAIAEALRSKGYDVTELELEPKRIVEQLEEAKPDVVFNAIHGKFGEDGALQGILEMLEIPYTGSGITASAVGMNKVMSKALFQSCGIPTSPSKGYTKGLSVDEIKKDILEHFTVPFVVKAATQGSTIGLAIVRHVEELDQALADTFQYGNSILVEAFLDGGEFTIPVTETQVFPIIKIEPHSGSYDYYSKYTAGATEYLCPAPISQEETEHMQKMARQVYDAVGCNGVARVDFMTDHTGKAYVLEINTIPGMTATSLVPKAAKALGISFADLCERILDTAGTGKF